MQHKDRWDLPKGHVDPGETELETAYRELHEETGITKDDIVLDPDFIYRNQYLVLKKRYGNKPRQKELVIFLGTLINAVEVEPTEHIGFRWFDWDPPHRVQEKAIDPILQAVEEFWSS